MALLTMTLSLHRCAKPTAVCYSVARRWLACMVALTLAGCNGTFIPGSGPDRTTVLERATYQTVSVPGETSVAYALLPLTSSLVGNLEAEEQQPVFVGTVLDQHPADIKIDVGDIVTVTIFESQSGGLFIPQDAGARPGNFVSLPAQQVDRSGNISVPFGGIIHAAGLTPVGVQRAIERSLTGRALEPQAVVTLSERRSNNISVLGDVSNSQRFPLDPQGDRLLSAISRAGGPKYPAYETLVTLQRGGQIHKALLSEIALDPSQNIALQSGDVVFLIRKPQYFTSLGAMGQNTAVSQIDRRFSFDDSRLSMADAVGRAGGLTDDRANPRAVFLFRYENPSILRKNGLAVAATGGVKVPTVYVVNFVDPGTLFLATRFPMRDGDILYTSNAKATELAKFLSLLLTVTNSGSLIRATTN